jgi:hypothetical protein
VTTPSEAPTKAMRSNKRTTHLAGGVVVAAGKMDPASPVGPGQLGPRASESAAFPRHRAGGLAERFNRRF